jgi:hypothetical protein
VPTATALASSPLPRVAPLFRSPTKSEPLVLVEPCGVPTWCLREAGMVEARQATENLWRDVGSHLKGAHGPVPASAALSSLSSLPPPSRVRASLCDVVGGDLVAAEASYLAACAGRSQNLGALLEAVAVAVLSRGSPGSPPSSSWRPKGYVTAMACSVWSGLACHFESYRRVCVFGHRHVIIVVIVVIPGHRRIVLSCSPCCSRGASPRCVSGAPYRSLGFDTGMVRHFASVCGIVLFFPWMSPAVSRS